MCHPRRGEDEELCLHPAYRDFKLESYIDTLQLMTSWIEVELSRREQERELQVLNEKLKHLADYDALTNVLNRRGMYRALKKDFNQLGRAKSEGCLAMVDLDHFKKLNDSFGHLKGDKAQGRNCIVSCGTTTVCLP